MGVLDHLLYFASSIFALLVGERAWPSSFRLDVDTPLDLGGSRETWSACVFVPRRPMIVGLWGFVAPRLVTLAAPERVSLVIMMKVKCMRPIQSQVHMH